MMNGEALWAFPGFWVLSLSWMHHPVRDQNSGHICPKVPRQLSQRLQSRSCVFPMVTCTWSVSRAPSCLWSAAAGSCCPFRLAALPGPPVKTTHQGCGEHLAASSMLMWLSLHQQEPWRRVWWWGMQLGFLLDSWSWACHLEEILSHWVSHGLQLREGYNHHPTALPVQACMYTHTYTHPSQEYLGCKWETDHG